LEDLIRNVHTLFDERPSSFPTVPSPHVAETIELLQPSQVDAMGSTTQHPLGPVGITSTHTPSLFFSLPSDVALETHLTSSPTTLPLGLPSPNTLVERVETASQEQVRGSEAAGTLVDNPPEVVSVPPTSIVEWRLRLSQLLPPEAMTIPQSPPESVFSSTTDLPLSSIVSL
jgi:hypothetical protein